MEKRERKRKELPAVTLAIKAQVLEDAMFFREVLATAALDGGGELEVASNVGGGTVLVTYRKPGSPSRTYALSPQELCQAVLTAEGVDAEPAT